MLRRTVFVSGCQVCPSLMAQPPTDGEYLAPPLIQWAKENDIEIVPMRCPETEYAGPDREPHGRAYYDKAPGFRTLCREIATYEADRMQKRGNVIAVIGVTTSPACGTNFTGKGSSFHPRGIFMYVLFNRCCNRDLWPTFISIWPKHQHKMQEILNELLEEPHD